LFHDAEPFHLVVLEIEFHTDVDALLEVVHHYVFELLMGVVGGYDGFDYLLPDYGEVYFYGCVYVAGTSGFHEQVGVGLQDLVFFANLQTFVQSIVFTHQLIEDGVVLTGDSQKFEVLDLEREEGF
jgi:hypothetical protein